MIIVKMGGSMENLSTVIDNVKDLSLKLLEIGDSL